MMPVNRERLLSSNLCMPKPRENAVLREALFQRLDEGLQHRLICIRAQAGSGKTTLLTTYFSQRKKQVLWLSLDAECNHIELFFGYLLEALSPVLLHEDYERMKKALLAGKGIDWLYELVELLSACSDHVLVLDNVHVLLDSSLCNALSWFLHHLSDSTRVILCGRELPDMYLSDLAMENALVILNQEELLFREDEELQFLTCTLKLQAEDTLLRHMCRIASGWIGGLQLLSMAGVNKPQDILHMRNDELLYTYITKEIFEPLCTQEQEFLLALSILDSFDCAFLAVYLRHMDTDACLRAIVEQHFILVTLDEDAQRYCFHDILKDYLRRRLLEEPSKEKQLHIQAAQAYRTMELYADCVHHYLACEEYEAAMEILSQTPQDHRVLYYLSRIPLDVICSRADYAYQYFFYYYANFEEEACRRMYPLICEAMNEDPTFLAFQCTLPIMNGDYMNETMTLMPLDELMALPLSDVTKSFLLLKDAFLMAMLHDMKGCRQYLKLIESIYEATHNIYTGSMLYLIRSQIHEALGEFKQALLAYDKLQRLLQELSFQKPSYYVGIAGIYMKQLKIKESEEALRRCDETNTRGLFSIRRAGSYTRAQLYCAMRDERGLELLDVLLGDRLYENVLLMASLLKILYVWKPEHAIFLTFQQAYEQERPDDFEAQLLYGMLLCDQGRQEEAVQLLNQILQETRRIQCRYSLIEACIIKLCRLSQREQVIKNLFIEALTYAAEQEIRLPFLYMRENWHGASSLLRDCLKRASDKERVFWRSLDIPLQDPVLSERELEVLQELAQGNSNKVIAEHLYISLATVKTHILNIYGKLQVTNRVEALNYYREHLQDGCS